MLRGSVESCANRRSRRTRSGSSRSASRSRRYSGRSRDSPTTRTIHTVSRPATTPANSGHHSCIGFDSFLSICACVKVVTCHRQLPPNQVDLAVEVFRMLADGTRVRLLWAMIDEELPVNELASRVGKPATSVSQHLARLQMARLVRTRREGMQVFYRLENDHV